MPITPEAESRAGSIADHPRTRAGRQLRRTTRAAGPIAAAEPPAATAYSRAALPRSVVRLPEFRCTHRPCSTPSRAAIASSAAVLPRHERIGEAVQSISGPVSNCAVVRRKNTQSISHTTGSTRHNGQVPVARRAKRDCIPVMQSAGHTPIFERSETEQQSSRPVSRRRGRCASRRQAAVAETRDTKGPRTATPEAAPINSGAASGPRTRRAPRTAACRRRIRTTLR